jgi:hypothetical protein
MLFQARNIRPAACIKPGIVAGGRIPGPPPQSRPFAVKGNSGDLTRIGLALRQTRADRCTAGL